jgi:hypothetical protein
MSSTIKMTFVGIGVVFCVIAACSNKVVVDHQGEKGMPAKPIEQVLSEHTNDLMSIPGVIGTAQGLRENKPCIMVLVIKKTPELNQKIPDVLEGYPVVVEETGEVRALPEEQ